MEHGSEKHRKNGPPPSPHEARKVLFQRGLRRGWLSRSEIDAALPEAALSPSERWLLFYSLRAAGIEIRDDGGRKSEDADDSASKAAAGRSAA